MREGPRPSVPFKSINIHLTDTQHWRPSLLQVLCLTDKRILKVLSEGNSKKKQYYRSQREKKQWGRQDRVLNSAQEEGEGRGDGKRQACFLKLDRSQGNGQGGLAATPVSTLEVEGGRWVQVLSCIVRLMSVWVVWDLVKKDGGGEESKAGRHSNRCPQPLCGLHAVFRGTVEWLGISVSRLKCYWLKEEGREKIRLLESEFRKPAVNEGQLQVLYLIKGKAVPFPFQVFSVLYFIFYLVARPL